ncbi:MAG: hypothetical protein Q4F00_08370 [bacterium]|nr:hypothetical protein [bacterium]
MAVRKIALSFLGIALALSLSTSVYAQETLDKSENSKDEANFMSVSRQTVTASGEAALVGNSLREAAASGRKLSAADEKWLEVLRSHWGRDNISVPDLDRLPAQRQVNCRLTAEYINAHPGALQSLLQAWEAMEAATNLELQIFHGDGYTLPCCNPEIRALLKQSYTLAEFENLYLLALSHGTFDMKVNPENGLVITSDISGEENREMACRQWVTDTVRTGEIERVVAPEGWKRVLQTLAKFYTSPVEQQAFDSCIANPKQYREGGLAEGVAHIFYPQNLQRDPSWFNNKRLESHGLALQALCQGLKGWAANEAWGAVQPDDAYVQAIANLAAYFISIDYATAPSAGNWEETPFPGGLTWDAQAIKAGLQELNDLLYDRHYDDCNCVVSFRERLRSSRHGQIAADRTKLAQAIASGEKRVRSSYMAESPGHREVDASLSFLAGTDSRLDDNGLASVGKYLKQLEMLETKLVREHGMLRYAPFYTQLKDGSKVLSPDSYLNFNYNIASDPQGKLNLEWKGVLDSFGSKDCSEPLVFAARASLATDNREAQWFMVSDVARGYANQGLQVLKEAAVRLGRPDGHVKIAELTAAERELFQRALQGATRNINRAYARITDTKPMVKANGLKAAAWAVPEAWQSVSTLDGGCAYLPGVNTPLTWAAVSLQGASKTYMELLQAAER